MSSRNAQVDLLRIILVAVVAAAMQGLTPFLSTQLFSDMAEV